MALMPKIQIWRSNMERARDRASLTSDELDAIEQLLGSNQGNISFDVHQLPMPFARSLLEDPKLNASQRAALALYVHGVNAADLDCESVYAFRVNTPLEFGSIVGSMNRTKPNAELSWNGRWYPVILQIEFQEDDQKLAKHVVVKILLGLGSVVHTTWRGVEPGYFLDAEGQACERTVLEVLQRLGFRAVQTTAADFNLRLVKAERLAASHGSQVWVKSAVLELARRFWFSEGLGELALGTPDMPRRAVVEPELETQAQESSYGFGRRSILSESTSRLPLVRLFSVDTKSYVFADVDDVEAYEYDEQSLQRLYLPPEMKVVLHRVFETPTEQLFGDLIRGKHGGIVILACGSPGVGKTLTAEVYAEMSRRPLYVLEFGELGTTVNEIEENLALIFARVVRWRAVLQFDECEIFLSQRGEDLERSAIVGIFLRMLDYYEGLLFLTTNRPEVLDHAIRSRVMLRLDYPDLDQPARAQVWRSMFAAAGLKLVDEKFDDLAAHPINGRQIRNLARLARILHPDRTITVAQVGELLKYGCR